MYISHNYFSHIGSINLIRNAIIHSYEVQLNLMSNYSYINFAMEKLVNKFWNKALFNIGKSKKE